MADDEQVVKRRLRTPPETMRERTAKLQNQSEKNTSKFAKALASLWWGFTWPIRALGRQIAKLERFKFFRIIGYILLPPYIRNSWRELKQVSWPNASQTLRLTYAVLVFSIIFGVVVAIIDFGLDKLFKEFIIK